MALSEGKRHLIEIITQYDPKGVEAYKKDLQDLQAIQDKAGKVGGQPASMGQPFGLQDNETSLGRLGTALKAIGNDGSTVSRVMNEDLTQSMTKTNGLVSKSTIVWQDLQGKLHKTTASFKQTKDGLVLLNETVATGPSKIQTLSDILGKVMSRALLVAPAWMAVRAAMQATMQITQSMIKANFELEDSLARISTVLKGTAEETTKMMGAISTQITEKMKKSTQSVKAMGEAFYFLKSSALTLEEAQAAFEVTIDLMDATGISGKEAARAIAGAYNTMGQSMKGNMTIMEKMREIGGALAYTYSEQDAEMNELTEGFSKLAPYIQGTTDDFKSIIAVLGFLNTQMLRSGRAGRLTGQAIIQLTKNMEKLGEKFGVVIDPNKPMNFLDVMEQLHSKIGDVSTLSAATQKELFDIFQTRGTAPILLILSKWDEFKAAIDGGQQSLAGFLDKIKDKRLDSFEKQSEIFWNNIQRIGIAFGQAATETGTFTEAVQALNDIASSQETIDFFRTLGWEVGQVANAMGIVISGIEGMAAILAIAKNPAEDFQNKMKDIGRITEQIQIQMQQFKAPGLIKKEDLVYGTSQSKGKSGEPEFGTPEWRAKYMTNEYLSKTRPQELIGDSTFTGRTKEGKLITNNVTQTINVKIDGAKDPKAIAEEFKKMLAKEANSGNLGDMMKVD